MKGKQTNKQKIKSKGLKKSHYPYEAVSEHSDYYLYSYH